MEAVSAQAAAARTGRPILEYGRAWMMDPATAATAKELGLTESGLFGFWVNGRAGVLGDVDATIAAAAIGFMAPGAVRAHWEARPDELSAWDAALAWFGRAADWGQRTLAGLGGAQVERLNELSRVAIDAADVSTGALFAGSARIPMTGDAAADAAINLNVLRELRGCAHLAACHAVGLGPHATIMSTDDPVRGGTGWAETFGWPSPHPAPDPGARARVEEMTTVAMTRVFAAMDDDDRTELVRLVDEARATLPD